MKVISFLVGMLFCLCTFPSFAELKLSEDDLKEVLNAGHWSSTAEDNPSYYGEQVSAEAFQKWITDYNELDSESLVGLGLVILLTSIAEWGVVSNKSLPYDPHEKKWMGPSARSDGKHLMSYALGGVGINQWRTERAFWLFKKISPPFGC